MQCQLADVHCCNDMHMASIKHRASANDCQLINNTNVRDQKAAPILCVVKGVQGACQHNQTTLALLNMYWNGNR